MNNDNKKTTRLFWIFTALLSAQMLLSAGMYFFKHEIAFEAFTMLGFPTYIIYPLGIAKVLGLIAIISRKSAILSKLAYAGFFYNMILAMSSHLAIGDFAGTTPSALALIWVILSYRTNPSLD